MFDPLSLLAIFGPLVVDAGKSVIQKYLAPDEFKPTKIEDYLSMRSQDLEMFKAMNEAGGSNSSYPWVEAVVRLMRPAIAIAVIGTWATLKLQGVETSSVDSFAAAIGFYLFGDRTLFHSQRKPK
jgi:hypothetical protein